MPLEKEKTYELAPNPPPHMEWQEYKEIMREELEGLLESSASDESAFQRYFERHPCMLPRSYPLFLRGHHIPFPCAVVTQPVLPGFRSKIPDFMWLARDSMTVIPMLIEIEAPSKRWATVQGKQAAELTRALEQLREWKAWFGQAVNTAQFQRGYRIPEQDLRAKAFSQLYVLIYGRRENATASEGFAEQRYYMQANDEALMTYDRLHPDYELSNYVCVRLGREGYRLVSIPPTLRLGPFHAGEMRLIHDREEAVLSNPYLTRERKEFILERWGYWDNWAEEHWPRDIDFDWE